MSERFCPGCKRQVEYDPDKWRNYSNAKGSGVIYVCGCCVGDADVVSRLESRGEHANSRENGAG